MTKRIRRELERNQAKIAARPAPPDPAAAQARMLAFRAETKKSILGLLENHKKAHGTADIDKVAVSSAMLMLANFLNKNNCLVRNRQTEELVRLGVDVFATAAAEAKRECEDRRIVLAV